MLVLLDFDGLFNAEVKSSDFNDWQETDYRARNGDTYRLLTSVSMGKELLSLAEEFDLKLAWLTDWSSEVLKVSHLCGLPELEVLGFPGSHDVRNFPKLWYKRLFVEQLEEPFVWLDDNVRNSGMNWSKRTFSCSTVKVPHLALSMNSPFGTPNNSGKNKGLRLSDLNLMRKFCTNLHNKNCSFNLFESL